MLAQAAGLALLSALSPTALHLVAPHWTDKRLKAFNNWLRANGRTVLAGVLVVAGGILLFDGIYGLITRTG